jgi:prevent-host-death family protein
MSSATVNIYEAKTHLSRLVDQAAAGEEIIIARAGKPVARLSQLAPPARRYGLACSRVRSRSLPILMHRYRMK